MRLKTLLRNSILLLPIFIFTIIEANSQNCNGINKKNDTLYYRVKNVIWVSKGLVKGETRNPSGGTFSDDTTSLVQVRLDYFLIPFIHSQIDSCTNYKAVISIENPNEYPSNVQSYDLLEIAINKFNDNLEYQFYLYQKKGKDDSTLSRQSSFFINPNNAEYPNKIITEIQKLFNNHKSKNKAPVAKIRIDNQIVEESKTEFYRSNLDTIFIDGSSSFDDTTPKKFLKFIWSVKADTKDNAYLSNFNFEYKSQKLVINEAGPYTFSLQVSDGVAISAKESITINIIVLKKPYLDIHQSNFNRISQNNLCDLLNNKKKGISSVAENFGYNIEDLDDRSELNINYVISYNKSRKYFSEIKSVQGENKDTVKLPYKKEGQAGTEVNPYKKPLAVLTINNCSFSDRGFINFALSDSITPGKHRYLVYTDYRNVTSNIDTVTISFKEKSLFSLYTGYQRYTVKKIGESENDYIMGVLQIGIRFYLTRRLSLNPFLQFLVRSRNFSNHENREIGLVNVAGKINYDITPWGKKRLSEGKNTIYYLSLFASTYQFNFSGDPIEGHRQYGVGSEIRALIYGNKPKIGTLYIGLEGGIYRDAPNKNYYSWSYGINIIYGLWNY